MTAETSQLLAEARYLPDGASKVAALEHVIAEADAANDLDAGFVSRTEAGRTQRAGQDR